MIYKLQSYNHTVTAHKERIHHIETKMEEMFVVHNDLDDAHTDHSAELQLLKSKIAYSEDRSRQNNMKFHGIPESAQPSEITEYFQQLMNALIPILTNMELCTGRMHRIPKLQICRHLPLPRYIPGHSHE